MMQLFWCPCLYQCEYDNPFSFIVKRKVICIFSIHLLCIKANAPSPNVNVCLTYTDLLVLSFLVNKRKSRGMSTGGHQLKKEKNNQDTEGRKKDENKKSRFVKEHSYQEGKAWKDRQQMFLGLLWGLGLNHWVCSPRREEPAGSVPWNTSLAKWKRPITQVTIKHFIFVNFFKFMIYKNNKDWCTYIHIIYYMCVI